MKNINTQAVGWIGLGQMGEPMAKHLLNSGVNVGVYNRDPAKAEKVVEAGGTLYPSVLELVKAYDVIFLDDCRLCRRATGVKR
ncbi:2-hydroxy-3-oxopropionate reductase [Mannheimia haemolytica]|nr:2-hydroxy-3-oxopropionate reductase [Mannheimia haemolytica]